MALAHGLGLKVVAAGVERLDQLDFLRGVDNDEYQGFVCSRPLPPAELERRLVAMARNDAQAVLES